jgi:hypothetical protein
MKGVIFGIFEDFIVENFGVETFEGLLDDCRGTVTENYVGPKTYPDEWLVALLMAACKRLSIEPPVALQAFGKFAFGGLTSRYPNFLEGIDHPRALLLSVHNIIHVEVKKLMSGATPPNLFFDEDEGDPDKLTLHYESARGLCSFLEGLLAGVGEHFGVPIEFEQTACTHKGDERCTYELKFLAMATNNQDG